MKDPGRIRTLHTVVLAAGGSRRLRGEPKQLLKFQGESLLVRAIRLAHQVTPGRVVLVLGAKRIRIRLALARAGSQGTRLVHNGRWSEGMATSLQQGLRALPAGCGAALLLVVDQPGVTGRCLDKLVGCWRKNPTQLVAAHYRGRAGVPAIIPRRYWRLLSNLSGDQGARSLLRTPGLPILTVAMPEAGWDIDRPADLANLRGSDARCGV